MSAHWERSAPIGVTAAVLPETLHDFGGFPEALYDLRYPVPGDPDLANEVVNLFEAAGLEAELDEQRPLDHGAWVPLMKAFPEAQHPVIQVSLPASRTPKALFEMGRALAPLRQEGVLLLASGGVVHNLRRIDWSGNPAPEAWAKTFDDWIEEGVSARDLPRLMDAERLGPSYRDAVPTSEHFDPLYFALGAAGDSKPATLFQGWQHGNLSLKAWTWKD
jgi:4,5-DOPA dioxygenase extradiol